MATNESPKGLEQVLPLDVDDEVTSEEQSKENDMLLYLWQRAAFMDTGQGIPREKAESLRLRIAQLYSYHTKLRVAGKDAFGTEQLMKDYLSQYSHVMDERDETKGMNNLCGMIETLLPGKLKEQRNWKSGLQLSAVKEMPAFKSLLKEAETYSEKSSSTDGDIPLRFNSPPCGDRTSSGPTSSTNSHPRHDLPLNHKLPQSVDNATEKSSATHKTQKKHGQFQYTPSTTKITNITSTEPPHPVRAGGDRLVCQGRRNESYCQPPGKRPCISNAKEDEIMIIEEEGPGNKVQPFSTARDEYVRQQVRKYGRGGNSSMGFTSPVASNSYGSSKKSLGTRRGVSNRFVPPIRKDLEEGDKTRGKGYSSEAEIRSRVLRGGEGSSDRKDGMTGLPPELEGNERLKNIEPRMVELIMNEIMDHSAPVEWSDIAGLEFAKAAIKEIVVWPMMRPDLFTGLRGPPKGILLFGPPGTGKTLIGKCIASQVDATFFSISASSLTSKWIGEGEKMVRALFAVARCFQPAVIFIDEIDSLLTQRSDTEHESSRRIKTEFLVQLDGATTNDTDRLLLIGATNRPQEIDEAARRRLVKRLYIPLPDAPARKQIVLNLMKQQPFYLADDELEILCNKTDGYSGADMANLCREAAYGPVREAASSIEHISVDEMRKVLYKDFEAALQVIKASVSDKDLTLYIEWNRQYGSGGK